MGWLKNFLGISELEQRVESLEKLNFKKVETPEKNELEILNILKNPLSTSQIAQKFNKSRSWASRILNSLEKEGKVKESGKKGRKILYQKV